MRRRLTGYLLITVLLMCPYLCLGKEVGRTVAHSPSAACSCCMPPGESQDKVPTPAEENSPECLCHGAIMDGSRGDWPEPATDHPVIPILDGDGGTIALLPFFVCSRFAPRHFPPGSSGRETCLRCARWLL